MGTQQNNNNDDKLKKSRDVFHAISATSATPNVEAHFFEGQFPVCFSCHKAISELSQLTNVDGKPIHSSCKFKIEVQKKKVL